MATQFCSSCGRQLPAEAQFCDGCGQPTGAATRATAPPTAYTTPSGFPGEGPPPPPPPPPTAVGPGFPMPPSGPPLGAVLGLEGMRSFLLQHELASRGRNYRVLDHEKRHLFTVRENSAQELEARLSQPAYRPPTGFYFGRLTPPTREFVWTVADSAGNAQGSILIQEHGNAAVSNLLNSAGLPVLAVNIEHGPLGGLDARAVHPDGRALFEARGNLLRHTFSIHDPSGAEVAKIHEAFVSIRDAYNLDVIGPVDPLCPLIFAILIDREKEESAQRNQAHRGPGIRFEGR